MTEYQLRDGCESPDHAKLEEDDRKHPCHIRYLSYRAAMSRQLVHCQSFKNWLQKEQEEDDY